MNISYNLFIFSLLFVFVRSNGFKIDYALNPSIKMGTFHHNTAKSNWDDGFLILNHRSNDDVVLSNVKSFKNRNSGVAIYSCHRARIQNALFAENSYYGIDVRFIGSVDIQDATIKGYTPETKTLVQPPYFNKPCISWFFNSPVGLKIPTEANWNQPGKEGANLTNVRFTDFEHSDECAESIPIAFHSEFSSNGIFDFLTVFKNVTTDGVGMVDGAGSDELGVRDIIIHDSDGSSNPSGQASSGAGVFVSDKIWMKAFAGDKCKNYPEGISYCDINSCFRTVAFKVNQGSSDNVAVIITRESDGKSIILPPISDDNTDLQYYSENAGFYAISLPSGSYRIEFLEDLWKTVWPTFVLPDWQGIPACKGFVSVENITFVEPHGQCEDLTTNGDVELGLSHWRHSNDGSPSDGEIITVEGAGVDNSTALRYINRSRPRYGVGQNLDTRCLHQSILGEYYEIQLYFRLEEGATPFVCNPSSSSYPDRCPEVKFIEFWMEEEEIFSRTTYQGASTVVPNGLGRFDILHGILEIDESMKSLERLYLDLTFVDSKFDIIVDNFFVKKLPRICEEDWVRNSNFEDGGKYWLRVGALTDIVEDSQGGKSLKIFNKGNKYHGVTQNFYLDRECLGGGEQFQIKGVSFLDYFMFILQYFSLIKTYFSFLLVLIFV